MIYNNIELPDGLNPVAENYIKRVIDALHESRQLLITDGAALYGLARSYSRYLEADQALIDEGMTSLSAQGASVANPYFKIARDSLKDTIEIGKQFGLTLASRGKIKETAQNTEESPLETLIRQNR